MVDTGAKEIAGLFDLLAGKWLLVRVIEGHACMHGMAEFRHIEPNVYEYDEAGRLVLADGRGFDAYRKYIFERTSMGFRVLFAETPRRLFHSVIFTWSGERLIGQARHICSADQYDSSYYFDLGGLFSIEHVVVGPRKRYTSRTNYTKIAGDGAAKPND